MTQAEEIRELRRWVREDIGGLNKRLDDRDVVLHAKLDKHMSDNHNAHGVLHKKLNEMDKNSTVATAKNTIKIGLFVTLLTIFVTAFASAAIHRVLS